MPVKGHNVRRLWTRCDFDTVIPGIILTALKENIFRIGSVTFKKNSVCLRHYIHINIEKKKLNIYVKAFLNKNVGVGNHRVWIQVRVKHRVGLRVKVRVGLLQYTIK